MTSGIRISGPLGPFRDGVEQALKAAGYSGSRVRQLLLLMAHLSRWLDEQDSGVDQVTGETIEQFFVLHRAHHQVVQIFEIARACARTPARARRGACCRKRGGAAKCRGGAARQLPALPARSTGPQRNDGPRLWELRQGLSAGMVA